MVQHPATTVHFPRSRRCSVQSPAHPRIVFFFLPLPFKFEFKFPRLFRRPRRRRRWLPDRGPRPPPGRPPPPPPPRFPTAESRRTPHPHSPPPRPTPTFAAAASTSPSASSLAMSPPGAHINHVRVAVQNPKSVLYSCFRIIFAVLKSNSILPDKSSYSVSASEKPSIDARNSSSVSSLQHFPSNLTRFIGAQNSPKLSWPL